MLKVFFGAHLPEGAIVEAIEERRQAVQGRIDELEEIEVEIAADEAEFFPTSHFDAGSSATRPSCDGPTRRSGRSFAAAVSETADVSVRGGAETFDCSTR